MDTRNNADYPIEEDGPPPRDVFERPDVADEMVRDMMQRPDQGDLDAMGSGETVTALFKSPADAQRAVRELHEEGFPQNAIGILMRDESVSEELVMNPAAYIAEGAAMGAVEGGLLGGALGFLVGALVVPGVGPIVAGGALASALAAAGPTALAGIGLGAATGGMVGALTGHPIPEKESTRLHEGVLGGGVAMVVHAGDRPADAVAILIRNNGDTGGARGNLNPLYHDQPAFAASDFTALEDPDNPNADDVAAVDGDAGTDRDARLP